MTISTSDSTHNLGNLSHFTAYDCKTSIDEFKIPLYTNKLKMYE